VVKKKPTEKPAEAGGGKPATKSSAAPQ